MSERIPPSLLAVRHFSFANATLGCGKYLRLLLLFAFGVMLRHCCCNFVAFFIRSSDSIESNRINVFCLLYESIYYINCRAIDYYRFYDDVLLASLILLPSHPHST